MDAATPTPGESLCRPLPGTGHGWQPGRTATASTTPFGQLASQTGSLTHNLRLPGQYADIKTGLYQNWWRDYDPALGRYLQADPIGLAGGANLYGYVEGNPVSKIDLPGLFKICCRPLSGLPFMGPQVGADLGIYHEHGFFEDEKGNALELRLTYLDTEQNRQVVDQVQKDLKNTTHLYLCKDVSLRDIINN